MNTKNPKTQPRLPIKIDTVKISTGEGKLTTAGFEICKKISVKLRRKHKDLGLNL